MPSRKLSISILCITVLLGILCITLLPDTVDVHWNSKGKANGALSIYAVCLISIGVCLLCLKAWQLSALKFEAYLHQYAFFRALSWIFWLCFSCTGILLNLVILFKNL